MDSVIILTCRACDKRVVIHKDEGDKVLVELAARLKECKIEDLHFICADCTATGVSPEEGEA